MWNNLLGQNWTIFKFPKSYDLTDVFLIPNSMEYKSTENKYWPVTGVLPIYLFSSYGDVNLKVVMSVSQFHMFHGATYHAENLIWSGTNLLNSCKERLNQKIQEDGYH